MIDTTEYYGGTYPDSDYEEYEMKEEFDYADELHEMKMLGEIE